VLAIKIVLGIFVLLLLIVAAAAFATEWLRIKAGLERRRKNAPDQD
jgi:hypothetical protein